jgi:hypothetical protein
MDGHLCSTDQVVQTQRGSTLTCAALQLSDGAATVASIGIVNGDSLTVRETTAPSQATSETAAAAAAGAPAAPAAAGQAAVTSIHRAAAAASNDDAAGAIPVGQGVWDSICTSIAEFPALHACSP